MYNFKLINKFPKRVTEDSYDQIVGFKIKILLENEESEHVIQLDDGRCVLKFHRYFGKIDKSALTVYLYFYS